MCEQSIFNYSRIALTARPVGCGVREEATWLGSPHSGVSPWLRQGMGSEGTREEGRQTHVGVMVIQLHHNAGWLLGDAGWLTEDLNLIEDECLVPGGVQSVLHHHRLLALVQEGDDGIGICVGRAQGREGGHSRDRESRLLRSHAGHKAGAESWPLVSSKNLQVGAHFPRAPTYKAS